MAKTAPKKIRGFLLFFVAVFVFAGIGEISTFFASLMNDPKTSVDTINMIAAPLLAVLSFTSAALIIARKKSSLAVIYFTLAAMTLYSIVYNLSLQNESLDSLRFIGLFTAPALYIVIGLYFHQSSRVKQTLVN